MAEYEYNEVGTRDGQRWAITNTTGSRLFYVVVEDASGAKQITEELNRLAALSLPSNPDNLPVVQGPVCDRNTVHVISPIEVGLQMELADEWSKHWSLSVVNITGDTRIDALLTLRDGEDD